jgi:hypothetical protein
MRLGWLAGVLLSFGPFLGFSASRTVGVPGDPGDVGNSSDWVGTFSFLLVAGLVTISIGMLMARGRRPISAVTSVTRAVAVDSVELPSGWDALGRTSFN